MSGGFRLTVTRVLSQPSQGHTDRSFGLSHERCAMICDRAQQGWASPAADSRRQHSTQAPGWLRDHRGLRRDSTTHGIRCRSLRVPASRTGSEPASARRNKRARWRSQVTHRHPPIPLARTVYTLWLGCVKVRFFRPSVLCRKQAKSLSQNPKPIAVAGKAHLGIIVEP